MGLSESMKVGRAEGNPGTWSIGKGHMEAQARCRQFRVGRHQGVEGSVENWTSEAAGPMMARVAKEGFIEEVCLKPGPERGFGLEKQRGENCRKWSGA